MKTKKTTQHVLITGASSGIGRACAQYLDNKGFYVFAGVRTLEDYALIKKNASQRLNPVLLDVCDSESIQTALKEIESSLDSRGLDGLINNAGIPLVGPLEYLDIGKFRQQWDVNVAGMIKVTQRFLPLLRKNKGRVINMGSISGRVALPFLAPYAATKFAMEAVSDSMRLELRPWNIDVSIIESGNVETKIRNKAIENLKDDERKLPPSAHSLYGPVLNVMALHKKIRCIEPLVVAQTVERILTAKKPKSRYLVGKDAVILSLIQKLPTGLRDYIIAKQLPRYGS